MVLFITAAAVFGSARIDKSEPRQIGETVIVITSVLAIATTAVISRCGREPLPLPRRFGDRRQRGDDADDDKLNKQAAATGGERAC